MNTIQAIDDFLFRKPYARERQAIAEETWHEGDYKRTGRPMCPCKPCLAYRQKKWALQDAQQKLERAAQVAAEAERERKRQAEEEERRWEQRIEAYRVARERERVKRWEERGRSIREFERCGYERQPIPLSIREFVMRRDKSRCVICGSNRDLEFDHIIPVSRGGSNTAENIEVRCQFCNRSKGAEIGG